MTDDQLIRAWRTAETKGGNEPTSWESDLVKAQSFLAALSDGRADDKPSIEPLIRKIYEDCTNKAVPDPRSSAWALYIDHLRDWFGGYNRRRYGG